jgi:signal transduction histidine kinase
MGDDKRSTVTREVLERQIRREVKAREHAEEIAERELRRYHLKNLELKRALNAKAEFCAMMSHELLSPVGTVISALDAIGMGVYGGLESSARRKIEITLEQAEQMQTRMRSLMECLALSDVSEQLSVSEIDLKELLTGVVGRYSASVAAEKIKIVCEMDALVTLKTDVLVLQRVIDALVDNAVKFTESGQITIRVDELWSGRSIVICVHDTGIGIEGRYITDIFEPFFQIDKGLDRERNGMGLGLYQARKLLKSLKGNVRAWSPLSGGSCFTAAIPRDVTGDDIGLLPQMGYEESVFADVKFSP